MSGTVLAQQFIVQFDCDEHNEHQKMVMIRHSLKVKQHFKRSIFLLLLGLKGAMNHVFYIKCSIWHNNSFQMD